MKRGREEEPLSLQCLTVLQVLPMLSHQELKKIKTNVQKQLNRLALHDTNKIFKIFRFERDQFGMFCMKWTDAHNGMEKQLKLVRTKKKSFIRYCTKNIETNRYNANVPMVVRLLKQYMDNEDVNKTIRHKAALYFLQNAY
jgi:hypothetical protein